MKENLPSDIEPEYQGSWDVFIGLPATAKLPTKVLTDCFRILLQQAGARIRPLYDMRSFFSVNKLYTQFSNTLHSKFLLNHLHPQKHQYEILVDADHLINLAQRVTVRGTVRLKPQRFSLDHLLNRLVTVKVLQSLPKTLQLDLVRRAREDEPAPPKKDRFPSRVVAVKDWNKVTIVQNRDMLIQIARLKNDHLALFYEVYFETEMPNYQDLEKSLFAVWRRASIGDLQ